MAIKSMIRLNQIKNQQSDFGKPLDLKTLYAHGGDEKDGLEETLSKLGESLHKRFGTAGIGDSGLHENNTAGVIANFTTDDDQDMIIKNEAEDKSSKLWHVTTNYAAQLIMADATSTNAGDGSVKLESKNQQIDMASVGGVNTIAMYNDKNSTGTNFIKLGVGYDANIGATNIVLQPNKKHLFKEGSVTPKFAETWETGTISRTDLFGNAGSTLEYKSTEAKTMLFEREMKIDHKISAESQISKFGKDTSGPAANAYHTVYSGDKKDLTQSISTLAGSTDGSIMIDMHAEKLNGDQKILLATVGEETSVGAADASVSRIKIANSGIVVDAVNSVYLQSTKSSGTFKSDLAMLLESGKSQQLYGGNVLIKAQGGSLRATAPANYGVNGLATLGLSADSQEVWFVDKHKAASWSEARGVPLSIWDEEWEDYEAVFGEVSLLNALVQAGTGGTVDAGTHIIKMDATVAKDTALLVSGTTESDDARFSLFVFNSKDTGVQVDEQVSKIGGFACTGLDANEILAAVKVYVNGQLLAGNVASTAPSLGNYDYHILDKNGIAGFAAGQPFSLKFAFPLEADDMVQVVIG